MCVRDFSPDHQTKKLRVRLARMVPQIRTSVPVLPVLRVDVCEDDESGCRFQSVKPAFYIEILWMQQASAKYTMTNQITVFYLYFF